MEIRRRVYKPRAAGAARGREGAWNGFPAAPRGNQPCRHLASDFRPPELRRQIPVVRSLNCGTLVRPPQDTDLPGRQLYSGEGLLSSTPRSRGHLGGCLALRSLGGMTGPLGGTHESSCVPGAREGRPAQWAATVPGAPARGVEGPRAAWFNPQRCGPDSPLQHHQKVHSDRKSTRLNSSH